MKTRFIEPLCGWPVAGIVVTVAPPVPVATAVPPVAVAATVAAFVAVGATVAAVVAVGATVAARVALAVAEPVPAVADPVVCARPDPAVNAKTVRKVTTRNKSVESRLLTYAPAFLPRSLLAVTTNDLPSDPTTIVESGQISCRTTDAICEGSIVICILYIIYCFLLRLPVLA